jgi:hypothetical protein
MIPVYWPILFIVLGGGSAAVALLAAGPTVVSVHLVTRARSFAPLVRGTLEQSCALGAAVVASLSALAWLLLLARTTAFPFLLIVHPAIAAAPWAAGELLSGPSRRRALSFFAALAAAKCSCWLLVYSHHDFSDELPLWHLAADALAVGLCSAGGYLAVRGPPATPAR